MTEIPFPDEQFCQAGDVRLCYEAFGDPSDPALLLIMGLGTQMLGWHPDFCALLADRGFHVIRYDNRDIGRSTWFDDAPAPTLRELATRRIKHPAYTLEDMADDGVRLLDGLGLDRAHVVGASMGGMIAQVLAGRHPERVLSLVSIMSMTGSRWSGQPSLRTYPALLGKTPTGRDAYVERAVKLFTLIGSPGFERDPDELRAVARMSYDRGLNPKGYARQLGAIVAAGDRTPDVRGITAPTLVIHGTKDRLIRPSGGRATAKAIAGARLMTVDGMGHDLPRDAWPQIVEGIADNAARAGGRRLQRAA